MREIAGQELSAELRALGITRIVLIEATDVVEQQRLKQLCLLARLDKPRKRVLELGDFTPARASKVSEESSCPVIEVCGVRLKIKPRKVDDTIAYLQELLNEQYLEPLNEQ